MAGAHDTGLGHPKAKDQVVSPQGYIIVPTARRARLLRIHWVTGESYKKKIRSLFLSELFFSRRSFSYAKGNWNQVAILKIGTLSRDVQKIEDRRSVSWSLLNSLQCSRTLTLGPRGA